MILKEKPVGGRAWVTKYCEEVEERLGLSKWIE